MISKPCETSFRLDGKTVVITGAASGIGLAISRLFAEKGAVVCLCDVNLKKAEAEAALLGARGYAVDVADPDSVDQTMEEIANAYGCLDILVNSAGVGDIDWAKDMSAAMWRKVIGINLTGAFYMSQRVGRYMIEAGNGGKIINLASQAGLVAIDKHIAYSASKAGIISMTKSLALEWGRYGIQVNAISPTATETTMIQGYWDVEPRKSETLAAIPAGRYCQPEEIACAALFLASQASNMITGENLVVDGGYTIH